MKCISLHVDTAFGKAPSREAFTQGSCCILSYRCIVATVELTQQCPVCKAGIPGVSALRPNCSR